MVVKATYGGCGMEKKLRTKYAGSKAIFQLYKELAN
jgi:hypothetical protein